METKEINKDEIKINNNLKRKKISDILHLIPTYLSTIILSVVLFGIIIYVLVTGIPHLNFKLLIGDHESHITLIKSESSDANFSYNEGDYFSSRYGIALQDAKAADGESMIQVTYIDENSPLRKASLISEEGSYQIEVDDYIDNIMYLDDDGNYNIISAKKGAEEVVIALDEAAIIESMQCVTVGGGARGSLITTLYLILITLVIAIPIGVIAAIFLVEYAKDGKVKYILTTLIDMTSGIPSIIFGFCGALIFIPFCNGVFNTNGYSILAGAFTMTLILLPTIIKTTSEALLTIPKHYTMASLALGASKTQTIFKVILPNSIPGILTATLLSIGRIIGESAALIFVTGTAIMDDINVTRPSTSLSLHIWSIMNVENPNYGVASAIAIFILIVVLLLSILVKLISKKLNKMAG